MKSNRQEKHHEACYRSLKVLREQVEAFFHRKGMTNLWFPDDPEWDKVIIKKDEVYDVIFFGNFLRDFLESGLWPFTKVRLWCLSSVVQGYLEKELMQEHFHVGLIGRNDLFPLPETKKDSNLALVYAGRISESKNIALLLEVYHQLDQCPELEASLDLFGEVDDEVSENYGRRVHEVSFSQRLKKIVSEKTWNKPPVFHGVKSPEEWLEFASNKTFISLSDFYAEDFGVAVAQAQSRGIPVIVSHWGGHIDVDQAHLKVPAELLSFGIEEIDLLRLKAQRIASFILSPMALEKSSRGSEKQSSIIDLSELAQCRNRLAQQWGTSLLWSQRVGLDYYADHDRGALFIQKYNDAMAGGEVSFETVFIMTDVDRAQIVQSEWDHCQKYLLDFETKSFHCISERDLFKKDQLEVCQRAQKIVYLGQNALAKAKLQEIFGAKVISL